MSNRMPSTRTHESRPRTLAAERMNGSPGFAAILSGLLPGLGQMYGGRWVRGILMILVPIFVVLLSGAFIAIADPLTTLVLRNAPGFTFLVAGLFFIYHVYVVADAFAGRLTGLGAFRGRRASRSDSSASSSSLSMPRHTADPPRGLDSPRRSSRPSPTRRSLGIPAARPRLPRGPGTSGSMFCSSALTRGPATPPHRTRTP